MEDLCGIAQYCRATSFKRSEPNVANCLHWLGLSAISIFYVFHKLNRLTFAAKKCCSLQNTPFHMRSPVLLGQAAHSTRGTCHCNGGKPACTRACAKKTCWKSVCNAKPHKQSLFPISAHQNTDCSEGCVKPSAVTVEALAANCVQGHNPCVLGIVWRIVMFMFISIYIYYINHQLCYTILLYRFIRYVCMLPYPPSLWANQRLKT